MEPHTTTAKKPTSFKLTERAKELLRLVSEDDKRSMANMLEKIIEEEAKRRNIKLP
jgi:hypothetical protein